jgi:hypothetical protein
MFKGRFDRNLLTICPIGGAAKRRPASKALFHRARCSAGTRISAPSNHSAGRHPQSLRAPPGTIAFVTN